MERPPADSTPAIPLEANSAVPDWSTIGREIHCPLCEYNLRGLSEPRCPECGYQFEWAECFYRVVVDFGNAVVRAASLRDCR